MFNSGDPKQPYTRFLVPSQPESTRRPNRDTLVYTPRDLEKSLHSVLVPATIGTQLKALKSMLKEIHKIPLYVAPAPSPIVREQSSQTGELARDMLTCASRTRSEDFKPDQGLSNNPFTWFQSLSTMVLGQSFPHIYTTGIGHCLRTKLWTLFPIPP